MSNPLQTKDEQWRERPNGATPVFDPGLSPLGTDAEAGGAPGYNPWSILVLVLLLAVLAAIILPWLFR